MEETWGHFTVQIFPLSLKQTEVKYFYKIQDKFFFAAMLETCIWTNAEPIHGWQQICFVNGPKKSYFIQISPCPSLCSQRCNSDQTHCKIQQIKHPKSLQCCYCCAAQEQLQSTLSHRIFPSACVIRSRSTTESLPQNLHFRCLKNVISCFWKETP